jgi:hypothetical protein
MRVPVHAVIAAATLTVAAIGGAAAVAAESEMHFLECPTGDNACQAD